MRNLIDPKNALRLAALELSALRRVGLLPDEMFEGARTGPAATPVFDVNGDVLFHRVPVRKNQSVTAHADIAAADVFGAPLLAVSSGMEWDEKKLLQIATEAARQHKDVHFDTRRFVAFSYPKVAVQFLAHGREVLMLELGTNQPVPPARDSERKPFEPSNFERWSLIKETPSRVRAENARKLQLRLKLWNDRTMRRVSGQEISADALSWLRFTLVDSRELHYSSQDTTHHPCYELHGQETNVWCVAASVKMLLEFYRYEYTQTRIAQQLGLGTVSNPNGLPYSRDGDVVTALQHLTSNALSATMYGAPVFSLYQQEIRHNRPLISFIPGHSRTVAGYVSYLIALLGQPPFRGLLV